MVCPRQFAADLHCSEEAAMTNGDKPTEITWIPTVGAYIRTLPEDAQDRLLDALEAEIFSSAPSKTWYEEGRAYSDTILSTGHRVCHRLMTPEEVFRDGIQAGTNCRVILSMFSLRDTEAEVRESSPLGR